jgi:hypothetical protein
VVLMGRRSREDPIDKLCYEWGKQRRKVVGVDSPRLASEYIGALRSTLGKRRDLHAGATTNRVEQHYPEVYQGEAFLVNQAYHALVPDLKIVMEVQYAAKGDQHVKSDFLCMSTNTYWKKVGMVRAFITGWMARCDAA